MHYIGRNPGDSGSPGSFRIKVEGRKKDGTEGKGKGKAGGGMPCIYQ